MADIHRRKGGATAARSHQVYMQNTAQNNNPPLQAFQQQQQQQRMQAAYQQQLQLQQQLQQQQQQLQMQQQMHFKQQQHPQARMANNAAPPVTAAAHRYSRDRNGGGGSAMRTPQPQQKTPASAKMGIKSGMTVEDLKRLTQKRMQQTAGNSPVAPRTPVAAATQAQDFSGSRPSTPTRSGAAAAAALPPKTGMTVQELKQLTSMRLAASQTDKAALTNVAKSQYRESLRSNNNNLLTPTSTPPRGFNASTNPPPAFQLASTPAGRTQRSRSRSSQFTTRPAAAAVDHEQMRYSYSGGQTIDDYLAFDDDDNDDDNDLSVAEEEHDDHERRYPLNERTHLTASSLQFPDNAFPPPPPLDEQSVENNNSNAGSSGFLGTNASLPSWSPPPTKAKKYESGSSRSFYNQQTSYYNIATKEEAAAAVDQNAVIAPPPGLSRRPSMLVPWEVAESVLNTPQTTTSSNRKQLHSPPRSASNSKDAEVSNLFAKTPSTSRANAAEAAAQLSALSLNNSSSRQRSGTVTSVGSASSSSTAAPPPPPSMPPGFGLGLGPGPRRGSFGNAAEFFKFRRRSKSRLELARDLSGNFISDQQVVVNPSSSYGPSSSTSNAKTMPGIDESRVDGTALYDDDENDNDDDASSDNGSSSQGGYDDDDEVVRITGGYDDPSDLSGSFVSFYHATNASRGGLATLAIPPPPPLTDDEGDASSTTSSTKGLPIMSPNGFRLRKVAELARRGSLSSEDKTRAKDEIIQSSLGIGASNAARILATKGSSSAAVPIANGANANAERPSSTSSASGSATTASQPPPGFAVLSSTPPRTTPRASLKKTLAPGVGIVRSNSISGASKATNAPSSSSTLEERLASAAQRVADCVSKGDMVGFQKAMDELDWLRNEASSIMRG